MTKGAALIFGGTSGYGRGIGQRLKDAGYDSFGLSRRNGCDVRDPKAVQAAVQDIVDMDYTVNVVVYSAGLAIAKETIENGDPLAWAQVMETNALGLMYVAKAVIPRLRKSRGHLISIGSIANEIAYAGAADYCASKAAQTRIMETLRYELLGSGIRQSSIEVGLGNTDFQRNRYSGDMEKAKEHYAGIKQLEPDDLGDTVLWLLNRPDHVNVDSITVKPIGQAHHGHLAE